MHASDIYDSSWMIMLINKSDGFAVRIQSTVAFALPVIRTGPSRFFFFLHLHFVFVEIDYDLGMFVAFADVYYT